MQTDETYLAILRERDRRRGRKTLVVCRRCHEAIHGGRRDRPENEATPESRMR